MNLTKKITPVKNLDIRRFKRTFTLPETVNDDKIDANYEVGILNILLPEKEEAKQKLDRKIKIS